MHDFGRGRLIDQQIHDACYHGVLRSADVIDREPSADRVFVLRRDASVVHHNWRGPDGNWQLPAQTRNAVETERNRLWTPQETHRYLNGVDRLDVLVRDLPDRPAQLAAVAERGTVAGLAQPLMHPDVVTMRRATGGLPTARRQLGAGPVEPRRPSRPPNRGPSPGPSRGRD